MTDTTTEAVLPSTLTDDQRRAVWLAQYRLAASGLSQPYPDSACLALANERVASDGQRASDLAAWRALRETLLPSVRALAQERDALALDVYDFQKQADIAYAERDAAWVERDAAVKAWEFRCNHADGVRVRLETERDAARAALLKIRDLGLGPDRGSAQWQIDTAREIARAALAAKGEA